MEKKKKIIITISCLAKGGLVYVFVEKLDQLSTGTIGHVSGLKYEINNGFIYEHII